ncbi:MAG: PBP1b-binding outer membrane lipoprotein LpoB, partial [Polaribacter sp.]
MKKIFYALAILALMFASCSGPKEDINYSPNALDDTASTNENTPV